MNVFSIIYKYQEAFASGLIVTLQLAGTAWLVGILIGFLLGWGTHKVKKLNWLVSFFGFLLGAIPFLVLLYWAHFPLQILLEIVVDPFVTSSLVLCLINVFGVAQIVRESLDGIPLQFESAARVCGLTNWQFVSRIQFPLLLRQVLPGLLNLQIVVLQMTLFASLISVEELFRVAQRINATVHRPVEIYTALAIFFIVICLPVNLLAAHLKRKYVRDFSEG